MSQYEQDMHIDPNIHRLRVAAGHGGVVVLGAAAIAELRAVGDVAVAAAEVACSERSGSCSRTRSGRTGMNCDLSSGTCVDDDVLDMPFVEIRSAHISGAAGPDAQEGRTNMKAAS